MKERNWGHYLTWLIWISEALDELADSKKLDLDIYDEAKGALATLRALISEVDDYKKSN